MPQLSCLSMFCELIVTGAVFLIRHFHCRVPTPVAVIISAAVFALAHLTPGEFPQLFVLGVVQILDNMIFRYGNNELNIK